MDGGLLYIESSGVLKIFCYIFFTDLACRNTFFFGPVDYLVVHIGEILDIFYFVSSVLQIFPHGIKHHKRTGVSYMKIVIYRRPADIHLYLAFFDRHKFFFFSCEGIIDLHFYLPLFSQFARHRRCGPAPGAVCFPKLLSFF